MEDSDQYRIASVARLREIISEPKTAVRVKLLNALDEMAADFIRRSPFLVLGTADSEGNQDVSPKGDGPGFVAIKDANTLLIPERKGNHLLFGLQNILANPHVGLIFLVPGTDETLRVNGAAELTADPAVLDQLSARGAPAILAIRVTVRECFFHCAKAFIRSQLWRTQSWPERQRISFGKQLAPKLGGGEDLARQIDQGIEQDYKHNL